MELRENLNGNCESRERVSDTSKCWDTIAERLFKKKIEIKALIEEERLLRDQLIVLSSGKSSENSVFSFKVTKVAGQIDYGSIPILKEIDLEKYRKDPVDRWRLSRIY